MYAYLDPPSVTRHRSVRELLGEYYAASREAFYSVDLGSDRGRLPLVTRPAWLQPTRDVAGVVGGFRPVASSAVDESFLSAYRQAIRVVTGAEPELWNGAVLRVVSLDRDTIRLGFELTDYYSYLSDGLSLAIEAYEAVGSARPASLPRRQAAASDVESVLDVRARHTKLGVNTFCVLQPGDRSPVALVGRRSSRVAEHPSRYSVMPAGTLDYRPDTSEGLGQAPIEELVLREFSEELLDTPTAEDSSQEHAHLRRLRALLDGTGADLWVSGFGVELLRGQPELTLLLYIEDPDFSEAVLEDLSVTWEFDQAQGSSDLIHPVSDSSFLELVTDIETVPSSTMAACQGLQILRAQYGLDVPDPIGDGG